MGFRESKNKLGSRVRSAFDRLKPSKSSMGLSSLMNDDSVMVRSSSTMPLPVLSLSSSISHRLAPSTLFEPEAMMRDAVTHHEPWNSAKASQQSRASTQSHVGVTEFDNSNVLKKVLEREGLLESPISIRLASLMKSPSESHLPILSAPSPMLYRPLLRSHKSGPFTPELVKNPAGSTPGCTTSISTPDSYGYFPKIESAINQPPSRVSSPIAVRPKSTLTMPSTKGKEVWRTPENSTTRAVTGNASPVHHFLRRQVPIPNTQPLSSRILQSILSSPSDEARSSLESDAELSSYLEGLCPGGSPMDQYVLDAESESVLLATHELSSSRITCEALSTRSRNSSVSTFMTNVTGYISDS
ncbi:uncharacterized protein MELLADRAFT_69309 [Melampsora larici-populina 98AG31]|uniref:Uncharacterized protein n=1 Tax=Melampsora larici-populina (strain 98AG31 / pathotype 3-4-7) TaxID=747676 RepID=F4SA86_MELLP|nr:uncharacterized protein MELLADRAFT_69309 [Melampsora larici-populina 98AG31]EGF98408.1 hypothetical protein MELLADRAFT_69309 [Melampsora larici-populina 98AG31]